MRRAALCSIAALAIAVTSEGRTVALTMRSATVAGEVVQPADSAVPLRMWSRAAGPQGWSAGAGTESLEAAEVLRITVGSAGGEIFRDDASLDASQIGSIRIEWAESPAPFSEMVTVSWKSTLGNTESAELPLSVADDPDGTESTTLDLNRHLFWFGGVSYLSIRLPAAANSYSIAGIEALPRRTPYLFHARVPIYPFRIVNEISPVEMRDAFFLPPVSTIEFAAVGAVGDAELRFGIGIVLRAGERLAGDHSENGFQKTVRVRISSRGTVIAEKLVPIVSDSSRWIDIAVPFAAPDEVRVAVEHSDASSRTPVLLSKPRLVLTKEKARASLIVVSDSLRRKNLSIYGYSRATAGFDKIGKDGYTFTRAYAQGNNTPTSVLSLLNSRYNSHAPWAGERPNEPSLPRLMSGHGFLSVMLVGNPVLQESHESAGFDHVSYVYEKGSHASNTLEESLQAVLDRFDGEDLFIYAHFMDPHAPYLPPQHTAGRYSPSSNTETTISAWAPRAKARLPGFNTDAVVPRASLSDHDFQRLIDSYDEEILDVSIHLENIWRRLERTGLYDRSMIVLTSDHGEEFYEHGGIQHGSEGLYEEVIAVPLLVKLPKAHPSREGTVIDRLVQHIDIYPTVLEVFAIPKPAHIEGTSLLGPSRNFAISEWSADVWNWHRQAITDGRFKAIFGQHLDPGAEYHDPALLFDLVNDPDEKRNLANERTDVLEKLKLIGSKTIGFP